MEEARGLTTATEPREIERGESARRVGVGRTLRIYSPLSGKPASSAPPTDRPTDRPARRSSILSWVSLSWPSCDVISERTLRPTLFHPPRRSSSSSSRSRRAPRSPPSRPPLRISPRPPRPPSATPLAEPPALSATPGIPYRLPACLPWHASIRTSIYLSISMHWVSVRKPASISPLE